MLIQIYIYTNILVKLTSYVILPQLLLRKGTWPPAASSTPAVTVNSVSQELAANNNKTQRGVLY